MPKHYTLFEWQTLNPHDREYIETRYLQPGLVPTGLSPFLPPTDFEPATSLGLRYRGEVIGWILTHKVHDDVIEYSRLYVAPERQPLGRAMHLIIEAVKRQQAVGISRGIFQVQTQNNAMTAFVEQRMKPCIKAKTGRAFAKLSLTS